MQYNTGDSLSFSIGDMYSFIQPIAFGIGYWRIEHAMKRFPNEALRITANLSEFVRIGMNLSEFVRICTNRNESVRI